MARTLDNRTGWIACRRLQQIPIPDLDVLPRWIERGRIHPDDYLVNPEMEVCFQAKEDPDLNEIFRKTRIRRFSTLVIA
jgi:hypothetical protein